MKLKSFSAFACMFMLALLVMLLPSASGAAAQKTAPADGTISYSGRLNNDASQPVADGMYAFTFALYDAADGGNLLWSEIQTGMAVKDGAFTVLLGSATPLPTQARINKGWLAVSVRGPGETDFTALSPRQPLNTAASSGRAVGPSCPHDHFGETWTGTGLGLALESNGAGGETLYVSTSGDFDGVRAYSHGTTYSTAALKGANLSTGSGVYGSSTSGTGVYGQGPNGVVGKSSSPGYAAVYGQNDTSNGIGVYGTSASGAGVVANNTNVTGTALSIAKGAFEVSGAGVGTSTTVFIHQVNTAAGGNICPVTTSTTVINNPLTNDDPNAILIITVNGGTMGSIIDPDGRVVMSYDANNICGFGHRWVISNVETYHALPNGAKFNVLVVKP